MKIGSTQNLTTQETKLIFFPFWYPKSHFFIVLMLTQEELATSFRNLLFVSK